MMTRSLPALMLPAALALAACQPGVAEYTKAPAHLTLASAISQRAFRFLPGSDRLFPGERARLVRLAARGAIAPSDRVLVAAAGPPALAARRRAAIAQALLDYGIITHPIALAGLPP